MAALVAAILDGYGVKKGFPEPAILRFLFIRRRKGQGIGLHDAGAAAAVKKQLAVGAVIQEKGFVGIAFAEIAAQKGEHPIFRPDLGTQNTAVIRKTNEAAEFFQFSGQMANGLIQGEAGVI